MAWIKPSSRNPGRKIASAALLSLCVAGLTGCNVFQDLKNIGDYLNLRNSLLNPSDVGRFDNGNPWGNVKPIKLPILETLDVVEEPNDRWASASDPQPTDALIEPRDYTIGAGDTVRVDVLGLVNPGQEWERDVQVGELGVVTLPNIGNIQIQGLTPSEAEDKIAQVGIEKRILNAKSDTDPGPQIAVSILQSRNRVFSVIGSVQRPNTYQLVGSDFRLLDALALAGDITGGTQPGLDYVYVIRHAPSKNTPPALPTSDNHGNTAVPPGPTPNSDPLNAIESIERGTTAPAPTPPTTPATSPTPTPSALPAGPPQSKNELHMLRKVSTADIERTIGVPLAQADLDAALGGTGGATTAPAAAPAEPAPPPSAPPTPTTAAETPAPTPPAPTTTTNPQDELLNQAVTGNAPGQNGEYVYVDGKWVRMATTQPTTAGGPTPPPTVPPVTTILPPGTLTPPAGVTPTPRFPNDQIAAQRVIRIPINSLREGIQRYNIVIQPGDVINVPTVEQGEFYMIGHVNNPGVYSLQGRKVTLKMAVSAAHGFDPVAIPRRCELWRRIGNNQEAVVQVNLQEIFDGNQPDIFLKPNDLVNVGTDMIAPILAVTRNAYRFSYGFGFVYDRNFYIQPTRQVQ